MEGGTVSFSIFNYKLFLKIGVRVPHCPTRCGHEARVEGGLHSQLFTFCPYDWGPQRCLLAGLLYLKLSTHSPHSIQVYLQLPKPSIGSFCFQDKNLGILVYFSGSANLAKSILPALHLTCSQDRTPYVYLNVLRHLLLKLYPLLRSISAHNTFPNSYKSKDSAHLFS